LHIKKGSEKIQNQLPRLPKGKLRSKIMIIKPKPTTLNTTNTRGTAKIRLKQVIFMLILAVLAVNLLVVLADSVLTLIGNI
jgi:hypothetical protein